MDVEIRSLGGAQRTKSLGRGRSFPLVCAGEVATKRRQTHTDKEARSEGSEQVEVDLC